MSLKEFIFKNILDGKNITDQMIYNFYKDKNKEPNFVTVEEYKRQYYKLKQYDNNKQS